LAFTAADIAKLKEAIATGARRVRYADGREAEFRTLAEMRETLRMMEDEVSGSPSSSCSRSFLAGF
jgi:hypothetical protein